MRNGYVKDILTSVEIRESVEKSWKNDSNL